MRYGRILALLFVIMMGVTMISPQITFAHNVSAHHVQKTQSALLSACWNSPSYSDCDGYDPIVTGCNKIQQYLPGDPWYIDVYWTDDSSGNCLSNFAYVQGPYYTYNGQQYQFWLQAVTFTRRNSPYPETLDYCTYSQDCIHMPYTHTWETDLLYGNGTNGENQVQVCIYYSQGIHYTGQTGSACSIWH